MADLKLGEPIPTGIPGTDPDAIADVSNTVEAMAQPSEWPPAATSIRQPESNPLDQFILFPMKLGLSIALFSSVMLLPPMLFPQQPGTDPGPL